MSQDIPSITNTGTGPAALTVHVDSPAPEPGSKRYRPSDPSEFPALSSASSPEIPSNFHLLGPIQSNFNQLLSVLHDTQRRFIDYTHAQSLKEAAVADERKSLDARKIEIELFREFIKKQNHTSMTGTDGINNNSATSDSLSLSLASVEQRTVAAALNQISRLELSLSDKEIELNSLRNRSANEIKSLQLKINDIELAFKDCEAKLQYANLELREHKIKANQYAVELNMRTNKLNATKKEIEKLNATIHNNNNTHNMNNNNEQSIVSPSPMPISNNSNTNQSHRSPTNEALSIPNRPAPLNLISPAVKSNASAASVLREHRMKRQKRDAADAREIENNNNSATNNNNNNNTTTTTTDTNTDPLESGTASNPTQPSIPKLSVHLPTLVGSDSTDNRPQSPPSPYLQYLREKTSKSLEKEKLKEKAKEQSNQRNQTNPSSQQNSRVPNTSIGIGIGSRAEPAKKPVVEERKETPIDVSDSSTN